MANATAAQAYIAVNAIEDVDIAADGYTHMVKREVAIAKIIADNAGVDTEAEALEGIELAAGKAPGTTADEYKQGLFVSNRVNSIHMPAPATDVLFWSDDNRFITTLS